MLVNFLVLDLIPLDSRARIGIAVRDNFDNKLDKLNEVVPVVDGILEFPNNKKISIDIDEYLFITPEPGEIITGIPYKFLIDIWLMSNVATEFEWWWDTYSGELKDYLINREKQFRDNDVISKAYLLRQHQINFPLDKVEELVEIDKETLQILLNTGDTDKKDALIKMFREMK